ncbi:hypothetical protein KKA24_00350 [Patescibacteria group bacterium]|nr:hypothetical protein [Patescibacteria group bacterium]
MTLRTRNLIFITLIISFLIIAPLTVLYSLGWRFDWENKKVFQTGIFYFKAWPKSADVYINGVSKDKTDMFFGSALVDNLIPKEYEIEIKKEGYHSWTKFLKIEKKEVTEAKNITLIPENPNLNILIENVEDLFFSPDNKEIITLEMNKDNWELKLFDLKNNLKSHLVKETDFSTKGVELFNLTFSLDSKRALLELGLKEKLIYYILEIDKSPIIINKLDYLDSVEEIYFHPKDENKLFIVQTIIEKKLSIKTLNEVDFENKEILAPLFENVTTTLITDNNIYYLNNSGSLFKANLSGEKPEKLNILSFPYKEETKYEIIVSNSNVFLKESNDLYLLNEDTKSFKKVYDSLKGYEFSPDRNKITYYNKNEIKVLFLEQQYDHPTKEKLEELFINRFSEEITRVFWYTNHYLIFDLGDKIKVAELDNRGKMNIVNLIEMKHSDFFFNNKRLYLLSENTLYSSSDLTP